MPIKDAFMTGAFCKEAVVFFSEVKNSEPPNKGHGQTILPL